MYKMTQFGKITEDQDGNLRFENFTVDCDGDPNCSLVLAVVDRLLESIGQTRNQAGLKKAAAIARDIGGIWADGDSTGGGCYMVEQAILKEVGGE